MSETSSLEKTSITTALLAAVLSAGLSWICFNDLAPGRMHADVLMNSIMSLQNITLFYWGQNRLLNVLPLLAKPFSNPELNLAAVTWLSCFFTFATIFRISQLASFATPSNHRLQGAVLSFCILCGITFFSFNSGFRFEFAIGHIEYPLSILLASFSLKTLIANRSPTRNRIAIDFSMLLIGVFVNPSAVLVVLYLAAIVFFFHKHNRSLAHTYAALSGISLGLWLLASKLVSTKSYTSFSTRHLSDGIDKTLNNLGSIFIDNTYTIVTVLLGVGLAYLARKDSSRKAVLRIGGVTIVFSALWILLFSSHRWVIANGYNVRYFTYVIYAAMFYLSYIISLVAVRMGKLPAGLSAAILLTALGYTKHVGYVPYSDYKAMKTGKENSAETVFYAGNYWDSWPTVFYKLTKGEQAIGLSYRGKGNRQKARAAVQDTISKHGFFTTHCIKASQNECVGQIEETLGMKVLPQGNDTKKVSEHVLAIRATIQQD